MQKITPFLWFDDQAEEAARFYTSIFKNSRITSISHYTESSHKPAGSVLTVSFEIDGQEFTALNGGPEFKFTPAISFYVNCRGQAEVDDLWNKLSAGGEEGQCGWLTDKYGVSWQVVPAELMELMGNKDPEKARIATEAMLKMKKIIIRDLESA